MIVRAFLLGTAILSAPAVAQAPPTALPNE